MISKKIKLAIVDDHQIVIDGLLSLLDGNDRFLVVHETTSPLRMIQLLQQESVDVLLTDMMMPEMNGLALSKQVKAIWPGIKILALSMSGQGELVNELIDDVAISGYVLKNIGKRELLTALEKVAANGVYFSEEVLTELLKASERKKEVEAIHLTQREIEIIGCIEKEKSNKEIAEMLFISERTVETHRKNIFRKTGINSVVGLIKFAYEHGLIKTQ